MPLTLTAGVQQAIVAQAYGYDVLIEAPAIGLALSWFYHPDATWEHRLLGIESLEIGIPAGGGVGFISQLVCDLVDDGTGQSLSVLDEAGVILGATITLKLLFTGESYAAAIPRFHGKIQSWGLRDTVGTLTAVDDRLLRDLPLPLTLVTEATHPNAPEQSLGQAVPIVYGSGNTLAPVPLLLVDQINNIYQVSEHRNRRMIPLFGVWPFGAERLKVVAAGPEQAEIQETNRLHLRQRLTETAFGANTAPPTIHDTEGVVVNANNLLDDDPTTLTILTTRANDGVGRIILDYAHPDPVGTNTLEVQLNNHRRQPDAAVTVHGDFVIDSVRQDGTVAIRGLFASLERRVATRALTEEFRVSGISLEAGHILRARATALNETGAAGANTDSYEVGQIVVRAYYQVAGPFEPVYLPDVALEGGVFEDGVFEDGVFEGIVGATFQGRTDDATGTITGTPETVLENPVDVLHSLLRFDLGLTVDPSTLAAARAARSAWKCAGGIGAGWFRPRASALDLLHSLCLQHALYLFPTGNGTFAIKAMNPMAAPTWSLGPAGSATDFLLYDSHDPSTPSVSLRRTFGYQGGDISQLKNAFEIRYAFHTARQRFARIAVASWAGTNAPSGSLSPQTLELLNDSQSRYGSLAPYLLDADFLYDEETAWRLTNVLIDYWYAPRHTVEFESTMAPLQVLLGETISVDTTGMPAGMRGQVFEVDRIRYDFEQGKMFLHGSQRALFFLEYFRIRDQTGTIWYTWIDGTTEQLVQSLSLPSFAHVVARDITPATMPYWWAIPDNTAVTRYVLPTALGQMLVQSTVPTVGTGYTGSPTWLTIRGAPYHLETNQFLQFIVVEGAAP